MTPEQRQAARNEIQDLMLVLLHAALSDNSLKIAELKVLYDWKLQEQAHELAARRAESADKKSEDGQRSFTPEETRAGLDIIFAKAQ